jgi:pyruvate dehydrogenase complex dehydrogenase (E1) component
VVATLSALMRQGQVEPGVVVRAIQDFGIDPERVEPRQA